MFDNIQEEVTRKFRELKMWVSNIDAGNDYSSFTYGLFFVYVYGIYEETVRQTIFATISALNDVDVKIDECIYELYTLVFSKEYDSLYNVGNEHKWEKRWVIADKFKDNQKVEIPEQLIPTDGKNIRYKQLESIAKSFGLQSSILPRNELGGYIQEMVDNRNYIAHGNKSPKEIGRRFTALDLLRRCDYISEVCTYIVEEYKNYINEMKYLK